MSTSIRQQILSAIETRLADMQTDKGYNTEIGGTVFKAKINTDGNDDTPSCNMFPGVEEKINEYGNIVLSMPVKIEGTMLHSTSNVSDVSEQMLSDIIECLTGNQWIYPFTSGGTYEIEAGDTLTGALSSATTFVQDVNLSTGTWAGGDAAGTLTTRRKSDTNFQAENLDVGANSNVAATTGVATYTSATDNATGGLADEIFYQGGGTETYASAGDKITGAFALFNIEYQVQGGNPYAQ